MSWYSASSRRQQAQTSTCALRWSYSSPESCPPAARTISSAYCSCSINLLLQRLWHRGRLACSFHARLLGASLIPGSNNFELVEQARPLVNLEKYILHEVFGFSGVSEDSQSDA